MKILFISNGFPPKHWAGTETYTANIAREVKDRGNSVQVLCRGGWDNGPRYWNGYDDSVYDSVPVRRINLNWEKIHDPASYLFDNPIIGEYVDHYLDEYEPDLVHVTSCESLSASVLSVVKNKKIPLVLSITDFWFLCPRINLLQSNGENCDGIKMPWECQHCLANHADIYRWPRSILPEKGVELLLTMAGKTPLISRRRGFRGHIQDMEKRKKFLRSAFSLPDVRLTASEFVKNVHINAGFDNPIQVQPYGHDLSWLKEMPGQTNGKQVRIGFIGQIVPSKGVHILLEAAKLLEDNVKNKFSIFIYGDPNKDPEYGARLREIGNEIKNVQYCGTYFHDESAKIFAEIDVLVVPSLWYDFPLIIYEAFAAKKPVIASNLGGMAEAVEDEKNGLLFESENITELAQQIERLIREPNLLKKLSAGISEVKTIREEGDELVGIYEDLINKFSYR